MKVLLMLSITRPDNPYKELLVKALEAAGAEVKLPLISPLALWRSFRVWRPDVVHLHWQHSSFVGPSLGQSILRSAKFFSQVLALRVLGASFVWTVHNIVKHEKSFNRWELMMCRVLARNVKLLIVHCPSAVAEVAAAYRIDTDRIRVVPHGRFTEAYPPAIDRSIACKELGIEPEARVILFFGQIRRYKGVPSLVGAFAKLPSASTRLIIAGLPKPRSIAEEIQAQASMDPRVITRFGFIPDDVLVKYLSACDLVALPYRDSLTSGAAILAASYGKPVLAPQIGCMQDFPPGSGIFFDPDDPEGLDNALERMESEPLAAMGKAAERYVHGFSWSLVSALTLDVYREAITGQATQP